MTVYYHCLSNESMRFTTREFPLADIVVREGLHLFSSTAEHADFGSSEGATEVSSGREPASYLRGSTRRGR